MAYYDEIAEGYNSLHKEEQLKKLRIIAENLNIAKDETLLDVGCGTAFSSDFFKCRFTGIDPSKSLLAKCADKNAVLMEASAENIPFPDNSFDIIISVTAIHNFKNIKKGLSEMKRVGKNKFAFSVLKKTSHFNEIKSEIKAIYTIQKEIDEGMDVIFICK